MLSVSSVWEKSDGIINPQQITDPCHVAIHMTPLPARQTSRSRTPETHAPYTTLYFFIYDNILR